MEKIQYADKVALHENPEIADINKVKDTDMNEIKRVVNANADAIPTNNNQLSNGAGYITKNVNNLDNYYKKADTYTKSEVNSKDTDLQNQINNKVEKVSGKQLSTNDFSNSEKQKLASASELATINANNISDIRTQISGIVSSGSNSNGSWIKWSEGTMICIGSFASTTYKTINFPQTFNQKPMVFTQAYIGNVQTVLSVIVGEINTNSMKASVKYFDGNMHDWDDAGETASFLAIGRWK